MQNDLQLQNQTLDIWDSELERERERRIERYLIVDGSLGFLHQQPPENPNHCIWQRIIRRDTTSLGRDSRNITAAREASGWEEGARSNEQGLSINLKMLSWSRGREERRRRHKNNDKEAQVSGWQTRGERDECCTESIRVILLELV